jgi:hypothetical protein
MKIHCLVSTICLSVKNVSEQAPPPLLDATKLENKTNLRHLIIQKIEKERKDI